MLLLEIIIIIIIKIEEETDIIKKFMFTKEQKTEQKIILQLSLFFL